MKVRRISHFADVKKSKRLKAVLHALKSSDKWRSSLEIITATNAITINVHTCIDELRKNGYDIRCKYISGCYRYILVN
jgi:biotin operon repressor